MTTNKPTVVKESGAGKLCESNGFLVPVLTGSPKEMGAQYGALMVEHMQKTYDVLIASGRKKGQFTDDDGQFSRMKPTPLRCRTRTARSTG